MTLVIATFLDEAGRGHLLAPFTAVDSDSVHLAVFEALTRPEHATWSFVLAVEPVHPPRVVADRASLNAWRPTGQQRQDLLDRLTAEELDRLRRPRGQ